MNLPGFKDQYGRGNVFLKLKSSASDDDLLKLSPLLAPPNFAISAGERAVVQAYVAEPELSTLEKYAAVAQVYRGEIPSETIDEWRQHDKTNTLAFMAEKWNEYVGRDYMPKLAPTPSREERELFSARLRGDRTQLN